MLGPNRFASVRSVNQELMCMDSAIDRFGEQVAVAEPLYGLGSRGAVVDNPAANPLDVIAVSHTTVAFGDH